MADKVSACRDFTSSTTDIPRILSNYKAQSLPTRASLPSPLAATSLSARFIRRKKNMSHGIHCIQKEPFSSFTSKDEKGSRGTTLVDVRLPIPTKASNKDWHKHPLLSLYFGSSRQSYYIHAKQFKSSKFGVAKIRITQTHFLKRKGNCFHILRSL